jgi:hypothetical protein
MDSPGCKTSECLAFNKDILMRVPLGPIQNEVGASSSLASVNGSATLSHGAFVFSIIFFAGAYPTFESLSVQELVCPWSTMLCALSSGTMVAFNEGILFSTFDLNMTDSARTLRVTVELENMNRAAE